LIVLAARPGKLLQVNNLGYRVGETHHRAKLADADVETILYLHEAGLSYTQIVAKFDDGVTVSKSTVRDIITGRIRHQTGQTPDGVAKRPKRG